MLNFNEIHQKTVINCETLPMADITSALQSFAAVRKVDTLATAILLAQSQSMHSGKGWGKWAQETSGLTYSECYHRAKVGKLLIACYAKKVLYRKLITLSVDKLLSLASLLDYSTDTVEAFMAIQPVQDMPIEQLRKEVNCQHCRLECQEEGKLPDCEHCNTKPQTPIQAELPGFSAALDAIWSMDADNFAASVTDDDQAVKCASSGFNLLSAYLEHEKAKLNTTAETDTIRLLQVKAALLDGIKDIENILAGVIEKENDETFEVGLAQCK